MFALLCMGPSPVFGTVPYWNDPRIHNLGNCGVRGGLHAAVAPMATRLIDILAYEGRDVRLLARERALRCRTPGTGKPFPLLDLCCGVGTSTPLGATGVDASPQMIAMARLRHRATTYCEGNAESWGISSSFAMVTIMFALHEMPRHGRHKVLENAVDLSTDSVLVLDIDPSYEPSEMMRSGEPFVDDYLKHIEQDVAHVASKTNRSVNSWNETPRLRAWLLA